MNTTRIEQIHKATAYPESTSVAGALMQVWNECEQQCEKELSALRRAHSEIEQILGKALGYPKYADDRKNFPDATEANGVCVGEHTSVTLADEAAEELERLRTGKPKKIDADYIPRTPHDWNGDEGWYHHICSCGNIFYGGKGRVICKSCSLECRQQ